MNFKWANKYKAGDAKMGKKTTAWQIATKSGLLKLTGLGSSRDNTRLGRHCFLSDHVK